ncbi:MAG: hypothetical protein ACI8ZM_000482 [Crocinitomix sp.]|jgi:hypothetical protein
MSTENKEIEEVKPEPTAESKSEKKEESDENLEQNNNTEFNNKGDLKHGVQTGTNYGTVNVTNHIEETKKESRKKEPRKGLPSKFYSNEISDSERYELSDHIQECGEMIDTENLSLITCVDKKILNVITNSLANIFLSKGYEIMELFFENYDRTTILHLLEDIVKSNFKREENLLIFVRNAATYGIHEQPQSLRDLNKIEQSQSGSINGQLCEYKCKIVYVSALSTYTKSVFKHKHIPFLIPFLKFNEKLELLQTIWSYQNEKTIPASELDLMDCLNTVFKEDDFEIAVDSYEINKKIFQDVIESKGIYPVVLFIGAFFRGLEFDEFEQFLFLLIRKVEKKKVAEKLIQKWNKKADKILRTAGLDNMDQTNYRMIDFKQEADAQSCKKIILREKRVLVDKLANIIASPNFFFYRKFRRPTTQKINAFIATFGRSYGRYYKHEIPFNFLDFIESKAKLLKVLLRNKNEALSNHEILKQLINKFESLKDKEASVNFLQSNRSLQISNSDLNEMIGELHFLKYLMRKEIELPENFNTRQVVIELRTIKEKAEKILDEANRLWNKSKSERNYLLWRFSDLLIEIELDSNSGQTVDIILDEAIDKQERYSTIFDILNDLHYKSEKPVFNWYIKSLSEDSKKERERALFGYWELLAFNPSNFFKLFAEMIHELPINKTIDEYSQTEKYLVLGLFLNFYTQLPNQLNHEDPDWDVAFKDSLFNTDENQIKLSISDVIQLLTHVNVKDVYEELFMDKYYFMNKSPHKMTVQIFFNWYEILCGAGEEKITAILCETLLSKISTKEQRRNFKQAQKELRSEYNLKVIDGSEHNIRKKAKEKRNQFVQFIKLIQ